MGYPPPIESGRPDLSYKSGLSRNINSRILTFTSGLSQLFQSYLSCTHLRFNKGDRTSLQLFFKHRRLRLDGGGTKCLGWDTDGTLIAALVAIPIGV